MSRRNASKSQDSLELLLDTICNTFGGVLFIAMLVIILLQQAGKAPDSAAQATLSPLELHSMAIRLESLTADLSNLKKNRLSQESVLEGFAPDHTRDQLKRRSDMKAQQNRLQLEADTALSENAKLASQIETLETENELADEKHDEAIARRNQAKSNLALERQSQVQEIRMPILRSAAGKQEIAIVLRYGRLYVWHKYGAHNQRLGLNTDDFVVVNESAEGIYTRPNPTRGLSLEQTPESMAAIRSILNRFSKQSCYLAIVVRPDSYGHFRLVRDVAIDLGLDYRLMPVAENNPIADRGGSGGRVQ